MPKIYFLFLAAAFVFTGCKSTLRTHKAAWTAEASADARGMRDALGPDGVSSAEFAAIAASRLKTVTFDLDSYTLSSAARDALKANASLIEATEGGITIEGHADELGTAEYNLALSERRAVAVRDYYRRLGLGDERLQTMAYGEEKPLCTDSRGDCWKMNRRAKTVLQH